MYYPRLKVRLAIYLFLLFPYCQLVSGCNKAGDDSNIPENQEQSIRQIIQKYYPEGNIFIGAASMKSYWTAPDQKSARYFEEFAYNTPENAFKQQSVYTQPGAAWQADEFRYFMKKARENKQVVRCHGPISPQCSNWAKEDVRTGAELEQVMIYYMTELSKELEANKDVVKWMDVVNETFAGSVQKGTGYDCSLPDNTFTYQPESWFGPKKGTDQWENPWTVMGFETANVNGESFEMPRYIRMAFELANQYAPGVKKIWNEHSKEINLNLFEKHKRAILFLRSKGIKVDGIGWQAHIVLGWEKNPDNIKNLETVIDWCFQNNLEFHITELDVQVDNNGQASEMNLTKLNDTRIAQQETYAAITETFLKKVNRGAVGLNFWKMHDHFYKGTTFASLFDSGVNPNPAYFKIKELLIKYGKKD